MKNFQDLDKFEENYLEWASFINKAINQINQKQDTLFFLLKEQHKNVQSISNILEILERRIDYLAENQQKRDIKEGDSIAKPNWNIRDFS